MESEKQPPRDILFRFIEKCLRRSDNDEDVNFGYLLDDYYRSIDAQKSCGRPNHQKMSRRLLNFIVQEMIRLSGILHYSSEMEEQKVDALFAEIIRENPSLDNHFYLTMLRSYCEALGTLRIKALIEQHSPYTYIDHAKMLIADGNFEGYVHPAANIADTFRNLLQLYDNNFFIALEKLSSDYAYSDQEIQLFIDGIENQRAKRKNKKKKK